MPATLTTPLAWTTATGDDLALLDDLQANILKGHVRDALSILFLRFGDQAGGRQFLADLRPLVKSAKEHLDEVKDFKESGVPGTAYVGVGLTKAGYDVLGVAAAPDDPSFMRGMRHPDSRADLLDPPVSVWEPTYRQELHAIVLIGDKGDTSVCTTREAVLAMMPDTVDVVGEETGLSQLNEFGEGIEHFGYVDGRSQPLFLREDIDAEIGAGNTDPVWDPAFALDRVLVPDPAVVGPEEHFGSYFVYRKLEQNVRRFKEAEEHLADHLSLVGADRERAGAMMVGRFEDGTPLALQSTVGANHPVLNDFDYDHDLSGSRCPVHAHIRKTNPRGSGGVGGVDDERKHIMARRGQTYGERTDDPGDTSVPPSARPTGGVGLLFMAFNRHIGLDDFGESQFDFTQKIWANNPGFPVQPDPTAPAPELDAVIGHGPRNGQTYPKAWGGAESQQSDPIAQAVRMKGGEYFFMPSLAFLEGLPALP